MLKIQLKNKKYIRGLFEALFIIFFILTFIKIFSHSASDFNQPNWYSGGKSLSKSITEAELKNKPHLIYFYTDWCGYCRKLEQDILMKPEVIATLDDFVKIKINPDTDQTYKNLMYQYRVPGYPGLLVKYPKMKRHKLLTISKKNNHIYPAKNFTTDIIRPYEYSSASFIKVITSLRLVK